MTIANTLYLVGTIGYFAFIALAIPILVQWHGERGRSWAAGTAGLLAIAILAAVGGFVVIGAIRVLAQDQWVLSAHDSRVIAGAAPWMAFIYLAGRSHRREQEGQ